MHRVQSILHAFVVRDIWKAWKMIRIMRKSSITCKTSIWYEDSIVPKLSGQLGMTFRWRQSVKNQNDSCNLMSCGSPWPSACFGTLCVICMLGVLCTLHCCASQTSVWLLTMCLVAPALLLAHGGAAITQARPSSCARLLPLLPPLLTDLQQVSTCDPQHTTVRSG